MENFFNWMTKPVPKDEVIIWFNIHNMNYEKIELYGDIFKSLNHIISDTYLGNEDSETKIVISDEDKKSHFDWCWKKMIDSFNKENVLISEKGQHRDYLEGFFIDTFYSPKEKNISKAIPNFLFEIFDMDKVFSKSDLDLLTELYSLLEKNVS